MLIGTAATAYKALTQRGIDPDDAAQVALGQALYAEYCAACHGLNLEGQPDWKRRLPSGRLPAPPHDATGHTFEHSDDALVRVIKKGPGAVSPGHQSDMPAFGDRLTDQEIFAVLAFIKSRWPERFRRSQQTR
ncbi:MAG: cytochrome c [Rhodospirillales bacterium]|nr:cytochrome c [Rhodospirillales bacterium]